ncbi:MAG: hypothetical protein J6X30_03055 [Clostridia bacterium]|nr:hypothetical protein [Clostridia bacterium]
MKKKIMIIASLCLLVCLCGFLMLPLAAQSDMTLALASSSAKPGRSVSLALTLSRNPGVAALYVRLTYDPAVLTLTGVRDAALLEDFAFYDAGGEAVLSWEPAVYDNTAEGVLAYLDFTLAPGAPEGISAVTLSPYENGILNKNTDVLSCALAGGAVTVLSPEFLYSETLSIDQEDRLIGSLLPMQTAGALQAQLDEPVELISESGTVPNEGIVGTGMTVRFGARDYVLAVTGDTNGDGACDELDAAAVKDQLLARRSLGGVYALAADVSGDGRVTITDFLMIRSYLAGKTALTPRAV